MKICYSHKPGKNHCDGNFHLCIHSHFIRLVHEMCWIRDFFVRFISLSVFVAPVFTTVTETTQNYTCAEELHHVQSEYAMKSPDCDQYWSAQDHSIATFLQSTPECHSPCNEVFVGRIVLTDCVNITLAVICTRDYLTEYRVHFYGERVPQSLINSVNRGHSGVFLPVTLVVIAIVVCLLCVAYAYKNNRSNVQAVQAESVQQNLFNSV